MKGVYLDGATERISAMGRTGERSDPVAKAEKSPRDVFPRVSKGPGDGVDLLLRHSAFSLNLPRASGDMENGPQCIISSATSPVARQL